MSFKTSFPEHAIDVTKNFGSIEPRGFYVIVSLLSCLSQHQLQPMPTATDILTDLVFIVK